MAYHMRSEGKAAQTKTSKKVNNTLSHWQISSAHDAKYIR